MKSYKFFIALAIFLSSCAMLTRAKEFLIVLSTKRNDAFPGSPCDYNQYMKWLKPVYDEAKTENALGRKKLKELETMLDKISKIRSKRQIKLKVGDYWHVDDYTVFESDSFAESICIGESAMACTNPVNKNGTVTGNCTCYDDNGDYRFVEDEGFCRAKPGAFCLEDPRPEKLKYQIKCAKNLECKDSKCEGFRSSLNILILLIGIVSVFLLM